MINIVKNFLLKNAEFTPLNQTPILLHDHNERVHENKLVQAREIYRPLIAKLSSV